MSSSLGACQTQGAENQLAAAEQVVQLFFDQNYETLAANPLVRTGVGKLTSYAGATTTAMPDPPKYGAVERQIADLFGYVQKSSGGNVLQLELGAMDGGYVRYPPDIRYARYDPRERDGYETSQEASSGLSTTDARTTSNGGRWKRENAPKPSRAYEKRWSPHRAGGVTLFYRTRIS